MAMDLHQHDRSSAFCRNDHLVSHAVTKGLNPNAPRRFSGIEWLGEVPKHWEVMSVRRIIARIEQGWSPEPGFLER